MLTHDALRVCKSTVNSTGFTFVEVSTGIEVGVVVVSVVVGFVVPAAVVVSVVGGGGVVVVPGFALASVVPGVVLDDVVVDGWTGATGAGFGLLATGGRDGSSSRWPSHHLHPTTPTATKTTMASSAIHGRTAAALSFFSRSARACASITMVGGFCDSS